MILLTCELGQTAPSRPAPVRSAVRRATAASSIAYDVTRPATAAADRPSLAGSRPIACDLLPTRTSLSNPSRLLSGPRALSWKTDTRGPVHGASVACTFPVVIGVEV